MCFSNRFERVDPLGVFFPDLHDFSKTSFPDDFEQFKCFNRQWFILNIDAEYVDEKEYYVSKDITVSRPS